MNCVLRLGAAAAIVWASTQMAVAGSAISNEPGDPYNRPPGLPKPRMVCAVGDEQARFLCPARLGPPLSLCRCYGTRDLGRRYFVFHPRAWPTIFSFDGTAW